jgi:hypothetical protein
LLSKIKLVGNYSEWIDPTWIKHMEVNTGYAHPRLDPAEYGSKNQAALSKIKQSGRNGLWHSFEPDNFPFIVVPPIEIVGRIDWWFVKMSTGDFIPFHSDHAPRDGNKVKKARRFWIPLQDYIEGHMFIVEGELLKNYSAGDLFEYDPDAIHSASNINLEMPRYTFNFAIYE